MSALAIVYSPTGPVLIAPRGSVTALVVTYDPPLRPVRVAPPSLRPAPTNIPSACDFARLLERLPPTEGDR